MLTCSWKLLLSGKWANFSKNRQQWGYGRNAACGTEGFAPESLHRQAEGCCHPQRVNLSWLAFHSRIYCPLEVHLPSCQPYFFILTYVYVNNECIYHKHQRAEALCGDSSTELWQPAVSRA